MKYINKEIELFKNDMKKPTGRSQLRGAVFAVIVLLVFLIPSCSREKIELPTTHPMFTITKADEIADSMNDWAENRPEEVYALTGHYYTYQFGSNLREKLVTEHYYNVAFSLSKPLNIWFTSYNPVYAQTDGDPCTGAHMTNVCELNKTIRTIALSQDLVSWKGRTKFHYGNEVWIESDNPQCTGVWQVEDTMNKRYNKRGDLFQLTRATNTSCWGTVYKLIR